MLFFIVNVIKSQENVVDDDIDDDDFDEELYSVIYSVRDDDGSLWSNSRKIRSIDINRYSTSSNTTSNNYTLTDNSLWNDLWFECKKKPSFTCVRTGVFKYLDKSLDNSKDLRLTDSLFFRGNKNKYNGFCENTEEEMEKCLKYNEEKLKITKVADSENNNDNNDVKLNDTIDVITGNGSDYNNNNNNNNTITDTDNKNSTGEFIKKENDDDDDDKTTGEVGGGGSLSDLSDILYDKGTHFLMTHDMEVQLPEMFFGGGSIKLEPKSYVEGNDTEEEGALVKIVFKPPSPPSQVVKGRVLHQLINLMGSVL
ncbi:conserved hypothetical protein [Pediculus humanus corporis]|uniref:Uncharacterized protein n=1 Tax=Pediculus humanus subsp. corporis TaxID=121224 RepID=E0VX99_PEDHC|nr:uncharacterized protein Phum_PHUM497620 [Pediculus humanus corporis]EEB18005.1 conserved hypothetical protein [Pediculus humanus corporis]